MKYTSAQAAKLLKKLESKIETIYVKEAKRATFNASVSNQPFPQYNKISPTIIYQNVRKQYTISRSAANWLTTAEYLCYEGFRQIRR